jgi:hypothetical protein
MLGETEYDRKKYSGQPVPAEILTTRLPSIGLKPNYPKCMSFKHANLRQG